MYKCPYCNHTLETKNLRQGLYGRCSYCRFAGYIPKIRLEEAKTEPEEAKTEPEEVKTGSEEVKLLKCCAKYKTRGGLERHWEQVINECDIHPRIWEKHMKAYGWD